MAGLYLHIPFCKQRCVYCDFYFVTTRSDYDSFVTALCQEIAGYGKHFGAREPVDTIYFGGGTPSLLSPHQIERILQTVREHFQADQPHEVTLELNPDDVDADYLKAIRDIGVDRLSIGIQSFYEEDLRFMNRSHSAEEAERIVPMAVEAGFENYTIDLIFGLPEQPEEYWKANLEKAVHLGVPHLSTYGLTIEPRTPLKNQIERGLVSPEDEDTMAERYRFTMDYLREQGYRHYEISNFARPGYEARHNRKYWQHANYLGFGPSAHAFWWNEGAEARRWSNVANLRRYEALLGQHELPLAEQERLAPETLSDEYVMLRLRTAEGLDLEHLRTRYGTDLRKRHTATLDRLETEGYIEPVEGDCLRLTDRGKLVCDTITAALTE